MRRQPPTFQAIQCEHCGAVILLAPPGVWRHTTHLTCTQCSTKRTINPIDQKREPCYTDDAPALVPA